MWRFLLLAARAPLLYLNKSRSGPLCRYIYRFLPVVAGWAFAHPDCEYSLLSHLSRNFRHDVVQEAEGGHVQQLVAKLWPADDCLQHLPRHRDLRRKTNRTYASPKQTATELLDTEFLQPLRGGSYRMCSRSCDSNGGRHSRWPKRNRSRPHGTDIGSLGGAHTARWKGREITSL